MPTPKDIERHLRTLRERIDEHGFTMIGVMAGEETPDYTYTLGMQQTFGHPDLIIFGLPHDYAMQFLNEIARRVKAGQTYSDGDVVEQVANMPLALRKADARVVEFVSERMSDGRYDYLQLVWPDHVGRMPWHPHYDQLQHRVQPLFFELNPLQ